MEAILWDHLASEYEDRAGIRMSMAEADRGEFAPHDEIEAIFTRYGGPDCAEHRSRIERELRDEYGLPSCE